MYSVFSFINPERPRDGVNDRPRQNHNSSIPDRVASFFRSPRLLVWAFSRWFAGYIRNSSTRSSDTAKARSAFLIFFVGVLSLTDLYRNQLVWYSHHATRAPRDTPEYLQCWVEGWVPSCTRVLERLVPRNTRGCQGVGGYSAVPEGSRAFGRSTPERTRWCPRLRLAQLVLIL